MVIPERSTGRSPRPLRPPRRDSPLTFDRRAASARRIGESNVPGTEELPPTVTYVRSVSERSEPSGEGTDDASDIPDRRVGGVLLAGGQSTRFEAGNKLLTAVDGTPIVRRSATTLLDSRLEEVVVVVGHQADAVRDALDGVEVATRRNEAYAEGQSTSVREGVSAARERGWDAAVFALGDMPFVSPATVNALLDTYVAGEGSIVAAAYEGKRGNPVLFDAEHFDSLAEVSGDRGGRRIVEESSDAVLVDTGDPGTTRDIDYEADLAKYTD